MSDSECTTKQHDSQKKEDDCWSDLDESLLVHCAHIDNEEHDSTKEKSESNSSEVDNSATAGKVIPMEAFNKGGYLCVTDLTQQLWCEQQLCFTLMGVQPPDPTTLYDTDHFPFPLPTADRPEVKAGKSVHLARELEVHDVVSVSITSRADKWGLHILNLLSSIHNFLLGARVAREVPIFGDPFGRGDLVFGIIDELRFDPETYSVSLTELKTRTVKRMPEKAQKAQHKMQVLMYKQLWDSLVCGNFNTQSFLKKLDLTTAANQPLGEDLLRHVKASGISASTLSDLVSQLLTWAQSLVFISSVQIEYVLQDTGSLIGRFIVEDDLDWLELKYSHCLDFWCGRRATEGVDVEEAWKCVRCVYSPICEWRIQRSEMLATRNQLQRLGIRSFSSGDG